MQVGQKLGAYEIIAKLGEGGMGEVYRAHDTRLGREVALKVLPAHLISDADARGRFEREARSVAALNHPHILAIFDFGQDGPVTYAVTELLDGKTLREHLTGDRLPARRGLEIARQIAAGLAAAHAKGIVHRDLKPENVFVSRDGTVKILDFGLARAASRARDNAPTLANVEVRTGAGTILGTVGYMSPEQVRAQEADHRADIFAFGAVLYEILSGRRAFQAETAPEVMTAILREDPPELTRVVNGLPPSLERLVRRCLEKDPEHRFQSARDLGFALDAIGTGDSALASGVVAPAPPATPSRQIGWPAALIIVTALMVGATFAFRGFERRTVVRRPPPLATFAYDVGFVFNPWIRVSPDGRMLAYTAPAPASQSITGTLTWMRPLDSVEARPLPTVGDTPRAWSPDSQSLLVVNGQTIAQIDVASAQRTVIGQLTEPSRGLAWAHDGALIAATAKGVVRLRPGVADPVLLIPIDASREEWVGWPSMLPDGRRFLYVVMPKAGSGESDIRMGSSDAPGVGTSIGLAGALGASALPPDAIVYVKAQAVYAQAFDATAGKVSGNPVLLAREVFANAGFGLAALGSSNNGVIAYRSERFPPQSFVWVDRAGRTLREFPKRDAFTNFDLSPDGSRVAVTVRQGSANPNPMWLLDLTRGVATNISEKVGTHSDATWSPDATRLAFRHDASVVTRPVNGGATQRVLEGVGYPETWSPDGRYIVVGRPGANIEEYSLIALDVTGGQPPRVLVAGGSGLDEPRFSPDGRWLTYNDVEPGRSVQIYAIPFPPTGQRYQLSVAGGTQARWRRDGRELFYLAPDATMMSVQIPNGDVSRAGSPAPLFRAGLETSASFDQFGPAADGQSFLIRRPLEFGGDRAPVHVIVNFDLRSRLAAAGPESR